MRALLPVVGLAIAMACAEARHAVNDDDAEGTPPGSDAGTGLPIGPIAALDSSFAGGGSQPDPMPPLDAASQGELGVDDFYDTTPGQPRPQDAAGPGPDRDSGGERGPCADPGGACESCECNACLPQITTCYADPICRAVFECTRRTGCDGVGCLDVCGDEIEAAGGPFSDAVVTAGAVDDCRDQSCAAECG